MTKAQYRTRELSRRMKIRTLAGVKSAEEVCAMFNLKPRWRVAPKVWGKH